MKNGTLERSVFALRRIAMYVNPVQIILEHTAASIKGDMDVIMSHYAEDAVIISANGVYRGHDQIRALNENMLKNVVFPGTKFHIMDVRAEGNIGYGQWRAENDKVEITYAVDTFVIRDGKIAVQTAGVVAGPKK